MESENYKTKTSAMKAKVCYQCETEMDRAFVVLTVHGTLGKTHLPLCSDKCLEDLQEEMIAELDEENEMLRECIRRIVKG